MKRLRTWLAPLLLACAMAMLPTSAQVVQDPTPLQFGSDAEAKRFHALIAELRCVMCQNQSLADSNAQIAHDLRREVLDLMQQGRSDREIKEFLVERYGEFVLYRPQLSAHTWLLWFGPALLLVVGVVVVVRTVRSRARSDASAPEEEQEW